MAGKRRPKRTARRLQRLAADNIRFLFPIVFVLALVLVASIAIHLKGAGTEGGLFSFFGEEEEERDPAEYTSPVPLVKSTDQTLLKFIKAYYDATAAGDIDAVESMVSKLSDEEKIRIQELSVYVENYPEITVFTKTGPEAGAQICYVSTRMKFTGHDWQVPGLQTLYVCKREDGSLFINNTDAQRGKAADYIQQVSVEDDVVDLSNQVTAEYNRLIAENADFSAYLNDLSTSIDLSVGLALSELSGTTSEPLPPTTGKFLASNTIVNVRLQPSEDADRIGQTVAGSRYALVQRLDNGWSEIIYGGRVAYVKSEYFTIVDEQGTATGDGEYGTASTATALEMVAIRNGPGTDYEQIGWARPGDVLPVTSYQPGGWSGVTYNGQAGYVKSQYFRFE